MQLKAWSSNILDLLQVSFSNVLIRIIQINGIFWINYIVFYIGYTHTFLWAMSNYLSSTIYLSTRKKETHTYTHTDHLLIPSGICIYHRNTKLIREREKRRYPISFLEKSIFCIIVLSDTIYLLDSIDR